MLKGIPKPQTLGPLGTGQEVPTVTLLPRVVGVGLRFGGSTPKHHRTSGWLPPERSSAPGSPARLPSARPNVTPGSLPARTQHLGKVPTDSSAFLPAQVGGGAPPAARPLGAGIAAARALPRAHPH